jgi:head-tail adaptor
MPRKPSRGDLFEQVAFDKRVAGNPDSPADYGRTEDDWQEQFSTRAHFRHLRGGESVMAGRLAGRHSMIVTIAAFAASRLVESDWRMRDVTSSQEYAVRDITPTEDRQFLEVLVESGFAP